MKNIILSGLLCAVILGGCATSRHASHPSTGQHGYTFTKKVTRTVTGQYLLYLPKGYETEKKHWPLIMFLHGAGERGDTLDLVKKHGPPKIVANRDDFPFIVVSPQCPKDQWWSVEMLEVLLEDIIKKYRVDENRVYLTGLSMGGFGTWALALARPDLFAAIAPICGGGSVHEVCRIKNVPVWAFHGAKDMVVPVARSQELVDALQKCGSNVKLTIYPEAGHDSWTETYDNPALYDWLLSLSRPSARQTKN